MKTSTVNLFVFDTTTSGNLITVASISSLEFARDIFSVLGIYSDDVLSAWHSLLKTGDARYFAELMKANEVSDSFLPLQEK